MNLIQNGLNFKKNLRDKRVLMFTAFLILGCGIMLQFRTTSNANVLYKARFMDSDVLKKKIEMEKIKGQELLSQITNLDKKQEDFFNSYIQNNNDETLKKSKTELDKVKLLAGLTDVSGSGVIITLNDAPKAQDIDVKKEKYLIHDSNVRQVIGELKIAGAQAIAINNERIMATSEQVCAGPTIIVNSNRYAVPYVVTAIGNPDELIKRISNSQVVMLMEHYGIRVDIKKVTEVTILKYNNNTKNLTQGLEVMGE